MRQNASSLNSECNTSYKSIKFIFTTHAHFQIVLTCVSDMVMIGIAEEKFYSYAAVFTTSLAKIGELSLWKQKLSKFLQYFEKMSCLLYEQLCQNSFINYCLFQQVVKRWGFCLSCLNCCTNSFTVFFLEMVSIHSKSIPMYILEQNSPIFLSILWSVDGGGGGRV